MGRCGEVGRVGEDVRSWGIMGNGFTGVYGGLEGCTFEVKSSSWKLIIRL